MKRLEKFSVLMMFAGFSLCGPSAWAADQILAEAKLDGLKVVPPVLTPLRDATLTLMLALDSQASPTPTATEAAPAQRRNPWTMPITEPRNQLNRTESIRLYLGQSFANGQPIATLCDNDITGRECVDEMGMPPGDDEEEPTYQGPLELSNFLFQGQQITFSASGGATIAGIDLLISGNGDLNFLNDTTLQLNNTESALELLRVLIKRKLIYVVINSNFEADVDKSGAIIGYVPPKPGTIGDGELRGTLRLLK